MFFFGLFFWGAELFGPPRRHGKRGGGGGGGSEILVVNQDLTRLISGGLLTPSVV